MDLIKKQMSEKLSDRDSASSRRSGVKALEDKLWGGYSLYALRDLENLTLDQSVDRLELSEAAWTLAGWYAAEGNFSNALEKIAAARKPNLAEKLGPMSFSRQRLRLLLRRMLSRLIGSPSSNIDLKRILLEVLCLVQVGELEAARRIVEAALEKRPQDPSLYLAMANTYAVSDASDLEADNLRLSWINRVYENAGLSPIRKADPSKPLTLVNLDSIAIPNSSSKRQPVVSIIMPVYNAQETLSFTLRGLLAQTWKNLEIILVDDCSTDGTLTVAEEFAQRDSRIKIVRQKTNKGSYSARNKGLEFATGEFITVHDSNDWSHPQKVEIQATHLIRNQHVVANYSSWSRVLDNMLFVGKFRRKDKLIDWNPSSFFFRRGVLEKVGGWDEVRISADAEFVRRTAKCFPAGAVVSVLDQVPLAFALETAQSLTKTSVTHGRTIHHGLRREYREAAAYWLQTSREEDLNLRNCTGSRRFPVPGMILPQRQKQVRCNILFVDDFNRDGDIFFRGLDFIHSLIAYDYDVALFHWPHYESDVTKPLNPEIRELAQAKKVQVIAAGEKVQASTVIIHSPDILQYMIDLCPTVEFHNLFVVQQQPGEFEGLLNYDPDEVRANLTKLFGVPGTWIPPTDVEDRFKRSWKLA